MAYMIDGSIIGVVGCKGGKGGKGVACMCSSGGVCKLLF